jgi:hypothetical protein
MSLRSSILAALTVPTLLITSVACSGISTAHDEEGAQVNAAPGEVQIAECKRKNASGKMLPTVRLHRKPGSKTIRLTQDASIDGKGKLEALWSGINDGELRTGGSNTTFSWSSFKLAGRIIGANATAESKALEKATGVTVVGLSEKGEAPWTLAAIRVDGAPGMNYICNGGNTLINAPALSR